LSNRFLNKEYLISLNFATYVNQYHIWKVGRLLIREPLLYVCVLGLPSINHCIVVANTDLVTTNVSLNGFNGHVSNEDLGIVSLM